MRTSARMFNLPRLGLRLRDAITQKKPESRRPLGEQEHATPESVDDRMIGLMRLTLASSALLIISFAPSEPDRLVTLTCAALVTYTVYSAAAYVLSIYGYALLPTSVAPWFDVGCFMILVSLSSGTSSIFFFF